MKIENRTPKRGSLTLKLESREVGTVEAVGQRRHTGLISQKMFQVIWQKSMVKLFGKSQFSHTPFNLFFVSLI